MSSLFINPLIQIRLKSAPRSRAKIPAAKFKPIAVRLDDKPRAASTQRQQVNLSVLRFTFGIPGLDESYLPRWIGYGFGSLLVLNHFLGSDPSEAQLRSEALGLLLAAFSILLPYLGKFLKGAQQADQISLRERAEQIFILSPSASDVLKEDLAWATYVLLRNTNTVAVLISVRGELCARGYWNTPTNVSKAELHNWFNRKIAEVGLSGLQEMLYFPQSRGSELSEMLPKETSSLLVQPVFEAQNTSSDKIQEVEGFVLVASTIAYAYSEKDQAWIRAIANKFGGEAVPA